MEQNSKKIKLATLFSTFLFLPLVTFADTVICECCNTGNPCTFKDFFTVVDALITYALYISFFIAVIMIIKGGMLIIFSEGDISAKSKGRQTLTWAIVGMFVAFGAWLIITSVLTVLTDGGISDIVR